MSVAHEQNNFTPVVEELPVSPEAQRRIAEVAEVKHRSQLRRLGGVTLFGAVHKRQITPAEQVIIHDEIDARRKLLTAPSDQPPAEVPESAVIIPFDTTTPEWSPTDVLATLPPAEDRVFDPRERAAGEYLDR